MMQKLSWVSAVVFSLASNAVAHTTPTFLCFTDNDAAAPMRARNYTLKIYEGPKWSSLYIFDEDGEEVDDFSVSPEKLGKYSMYHRVYKTQDGAFLKISKYAGETTGPRIGFTGYKAAFHDYRYRIGHTKPVKLVCKDMTKRR